MAAEPIAAPPALPPSVAEWEDLLVRVELMPRALRSTLEGDAGGPVVDGLLREMVEREARFGRWLQGLADAAAGVPAEAAAGAAAAGAGSGDLPERFARLRARTFAMVQRRGLEVWRWAGELEGYGAPTVYQALTLLVREDVRALAALRAARGGAAT
jgi:hypothetical protein